MRYEILNYEKYRKRIDNILNNPNNVNKVFDMGPIIYTKFDFPVDHYTIGNGDKHIIFMGGTHGNELISVDFVTQLMEQIAIGNPYFKDIDFSEVTLDFFPLQNPEGFTISTSAVASIINDDLPEWEIERIAHKYYEAFKQDDINAKALGLLPKIVLMNIQKEHQKMFAKFSAKDLSDSDYELKENIMRLESIFKYPAGSLVSWASNGSGIDLNANTPDNPRIKDIYDGTNGFKYAIGRYNNIINNVPSPMGTPCIDKEKFSFEKENLAILEFIANLHEKEAYLSLFTYHGTGGFIYNKPYPFNSEDEYFKRNAKINELLSERYGEVTGYKTSGLSFLDNPTLSGCGDLFRSLWPGVLLIELSKMGGNPIGPYGDKETFLETMNRNVIAVSECIKLTLMLENEIKTNYFKR